MVKFRCKRSGNIVSFINEADIAGLRTHEGYEEIKDEKTNEIANEIPEQKDADEKEVLKQRGRPKKQ